MPSFAEPSEPYSKVPSHDDEVCRVVRTSSDECVKEAEKVQQRGPGQPFGPAWTFRDCEQHGAWGDGAEAARQEEERKAKEEWDQKPWWEKRPPQNDPPQEKGLLDRILDTLGQWAS